MPKNVNEKALAARERKAAAKDSAKATEEKAKEDAYWVGGGQGSIDQGRARLPSWRRKRCTVRCQAAAGALGARSPLSAQPGSREAGEGAETRQGVGSRGREAATRTIGGCRHGVLRGDSPRAR
jgi:hypothetical protein